MKRLLFLFCVWLIYAAGFSQEIIFAEYFVDDDPGYGNGTLVSFAKNENAEVSFNVNPSGLADGLHTLFIRVKDNNGRWSTTIYKPFLVGKYGFDPKPLVVQAEYFFDHDPGYGAGFQFPTDPQQTTEIEFVIPLENLSQGWHTLFFRAKDDNGKWGHVQYRPFVKLYVPDDPVVINQMEYFIDDDPGVGNGIPVSVEQATTVEKSFIVYPGELPAGAHQLFIRARDDRNNWSIVYNDEFEIEALPDCPPPTALNATDITTTSAMITWNPGGNETTWDILWGEAGFDPMVSGNLIEDLPVTGYLLDGLLPATSYDVYVRAICSGGNYSIWAGPESFITEEETVVSVPTVTTAPVEQITQTGAISGGNVTNDGGAEVTARGVVWGTTQNPTIETNEGITFDGTGFGAWVSELAELTPATDYFVRAYATNSVGTAYGEQLTFTTLSGGPPNWEPNPNLQYNMQVIGKLQYEDETFSLNGDDLVGAFVGEECRGVMSPDPNFMGIIFLTIGSNSQSGETITFKAYLQNTNEIVELNQTLVFENQLQVGSIPEPYIFNYHYLGPPNWEPNPFLQYNMQIIGQLEYEDGEISINGNDIIGAFVGEECRGVMSPDPNLMGILFLTVGSNQQSGESVTFRAYLAGENRIVDLNETLTFQNQLQVGNIPDPFVFSYGEIISHSISIPSGWSGISSYVIPSQPAMEDVFGPISNELIIAQTMTQMYFPGENINQIGNWVSHSAYKVKATAACTLPIAGELETDMTVSLDAGWNLLPVVSPSGANAAGLLSLVNGFVIAKDVAGIGVYWPQYSINSIGNLQSGKAYYVLLTAPGVVDFTGMKSSGMVKNLTGFQNLSGLGITPTPSTHTIAILPLALKDLEVGTIIGAFDQNGNCFGVTIIGEEANHLTIFGDDPTTAEKDGFFEEEMILFKNLTGYGNLSGLEPTFDQNLPQSDGLYTENGLSAITGFESSTGVGFADFGRLVIIFPNPSDGVVSITGLQPGSKITVTDVQGQVVLVAETSEAGQTYVDLTYDHAGVYFVKIEIYGQNIFRKIVLR
ncbi:MAG: T9SS type A sorting domain-containing protein [Bacteroidales bacterium]|nr:T9SS type A sorting domain-containing protein [Bacteroidales bacterium]